MPREAQLLRLGNLGSNGSWPCENALEGVSADRDRPGTIRRDRFEHIFAIWVPEASLARRAAILSRSEGSQRPRSGRLRPRSPPSAA